MFCIHVKKQIDNTCIAVLEENKLERNHDGCPEEPYCVVTDAMSRSMRSMKLVYQLNCGFRAVRVCLYTSKPLFKNVEARERLSDYLLGKRPPSQYSVRRFARGQHKRNETQIAVVQMVLSYKFKVLHQEMLKKSFTLDLRDLCVSSMACAVSRNTRA